MRGIKVKFALVSFSERSKHMINKSRHQWLKDAEPQMTHKHDISETPETIASNRYLSMSRNVKDYIRSQTICDVEWDWIDAADIFSDRLDRDCEYFFEFSENIWYCVSDEWKKKITQNRNIIISRVLEPNLRDHVYLTYAGIKSLDYDICAPELVNGAKNFFVVLDNHSNDLVDYRPGVQFVGGFCWLLEGGSALSPEKMGAAKYPWTQNLGMSYRAYIERSFRDWHKRPFDYTALIGWYKLHRISFLYELYKSGLQDKGIIGTHQPARTSPEDLAAATYADLRRIYGDEEWDPEIKIPTWHLKPKFEASDINQDGEKINDRWIAPEWVLNSKIWISCESVFTLTEDDTVTLEGKQSIPCTQITEKTFKAMALGVPFLLTGANDSLDVLEDWGFKTFRDVFGDYVGKNYKETNKNICNILSDLKRYDAERIKESVLFNYDYMASNNTLTKFSAKPYIDMLKRAKQ